MSRTTVLIAVAAGLIQISSACAAQEVKSEVAQPVHGSSSNGNDNDQCAPDAMESAVDAMIGGNLWPYQVKHIEDVYENSGHDYIPSVARFLKATRSWKDVRVVRKWRKPIYVRIRNAPYGSLRSIKNKFESTSRFTGVPVTFAGLIDLNKVNVEVSFFGDVGDSVYCVSDLCYGHVGEIRTNYRMNFYNFPVLGKTVTYARSDYKHYRDFVPFTPKSEGEHVWGGILANSRGEIESGVCYINANLDSKRRNYAIDECAIRVMGIVGPDSGAVPSIKIRENEDERSGQLRTLNRALGVLSRFDALTGLNRTEALNLVRKDCVKNNR